MRKIIFIIICLFLISGCRTHFQREQELNALTELCLEVYDLGYVVGKHNLDKEEYKNFIIESIENIKNDK